MVERRDPARRSRERGRVGIAIGDHGGSAAGLSALLQLSREVAGALERQRPVVALETSIVGQGLPAPHNLYAAKGCEAAIREVGAVPATIAVLDGSVHVGLTDAELERIAEASVKVSSRDLGPAIAHHQAGATTVAAVVQVCAQSGIRFFATGGIGGVHRGHPEDQSADLEAIARSPVAVFCAGAKIILDLRLTLERLESLGVPVVGYGCDEFPAFYSTHSGLGVSSRVDGPKQAAQAIRAGWDLGGQGMVIAVPPPYELENAEQIALRAAADVSDVTGAAVTPRMLARMAELSGGRSVELNVELVINNARVAAEVAKTFFDEGDHRR